MAGINIPFTSDTAPFLRGIKDVEGSLDDVKDSLDDLDRTAEDVGDDAGRALADGVEDGLDDVGRAAKDAGQEIADGIEDGLDDAGRAAKDAGDEIGDRLEDGADKAADSADDLERKFSDAFDKVKADAQSAGDDVGREVKRGTDEAGEGFDELKDEAGSSGREAAASFSGEFDDITDFVQETAANAFSGFGPAGAAAGIAAALGLGVLTAEIEKAKERAQEAAENVGDLAGEMIDLGSTDRSAEQIRDALREAATEAEDGTNQLSEWADMAAAAGVSADDFALAMVGDTEALVRVNEQLAESEREVNAAAEEQEPVMEDLRYTYRGAHGEVVHLRTGIDEARGALEEQGTATDEAARLFGLYQDSVDGGTEANIRHEESMRELSEAVSDYLGSAGEDWEEYTEDGVVNLDEYNAHIERHAEAVGNFQRNLITASATLSDEALAYIREMGPEAAPLLQAFVDAPLDQQQRTAENWDRLARVSSDSYEAGLDLTGPIGREIGNAQGYADRNPVRVGITLSAHNLGAQVGAAVAAARPAPIPVTFTAKTIR